MPDAGAALGIEVRAPRTAGIGSSRARRTIRWATWRGPPASTCGRSRSPDWWRRAGGEPLLGQLADQGNLPVALVPAKPSVRWGGPAYQLFDHEGRSRPVDRRSPGGSASRPGRSTEPCPTNRRRKFDLVRFSLKLPGLARELWMVFFMALLAALFGLSIPIAAGILVDQVIPEADLSSLGVMCGFLVVLSLVGGDIPGGARALGAAHRRTRVGDDHSGGLGPLAPASHGFFRQVQLGRPGLPGDGIHARFSRRSPGRR